MAGLSTDPYKFTANGLPTFIPRHAQELLIVQIVILNYRRLRHARLGAWIEGNAMCASVVLSCK